MNLKGKNIILLFLAAGIFAMLLPGCTNKSSSGIADKNKLAARYYGNDARWYLDNIPFFECSDKQIEEVYYYRWKMYKAHIRQVKPPYNYVVTEFLQHMDWDREPYCTITAASMFHVYEGRWLTSQAIIKGYLGYLNKGGGNNRMYSESLADATYAAYLVNTDSAFAIEQLGSLKETYEQWSDHFDRDKGLYAITPNFDATEFSIASMDGSGGKNGYGSEAFRPTANSYMYSNALAISRLALMTGDTVSSRIYLQRAASLKNNLQNGLWNPTLEHFTDRLKDNSEYKKYWDYISGRELAGLVPWQYNLPDDKPEYNAAWQHVADSTRLMGKYGLRTVEPSYPYYMKQYAWYNGDKPGCQWNGPSWPYQTTQVLMGMANLLSNYSQQIVTTSDYVNLLRQYTAQHYDNGILNIQQDYNPETGKPIVVDYFGNHYNHSAYNDLIITGLCGLRPSESDTLVIYPLNDQSIGYFCLEDVPYHGHKLTLVYDADGSKYKLGKGLTVFVNGEKAILAQSNKQYKVFIGKPVVQTVKEQPVNYALNIHGINNTSVYAPAVPGAKKFTGYPIPSASVNSIPDSLMKAIDGRVWYFPENNKDNWTTLGSTSDTDWYAIDFGQPIEISEVKLHLYADDKIYGKPDSFSIEYFDGKQWFPVKENQRVPAQPLENTTNTVSFEKVAASRIRVSFVHQSGKPAVALAEAECY